MTRAKPVHIARCGNVAVRVVRNGKGTYLVAWREFSGAPRRRETFSVRKAALDRADEIARTLANGQAESVKLTGADREAWRRIVLLCAPTGVPPHTLVEEALAARAVLPAGRTLHEAAQRLAAELDRAASHLPPALELVALLLAALRNHPHRPRSEVRLRELKHRLERFAGVFPDVAAVEKEDIERYLLALGGAAKTHDNHLGAIVQLYHFAERHGWPPARTIPTAGLVRYYEPGEPATFTPSVLRRIMAAVSREWIPFFAIGAFAGLRPTEVFRLRWENFRWHEKVIAVPACVAAKTRRPRLVPIADNLEQWLLPWRHALGLLYPGASIKGRQNAQGREIKRLRKAVEGLVWHNDVLRHSFGSHRLAQCQSIGQVALEMGTGQEMLKRHYNNPATAAQAAEWFAIAPDGARTVVPLRAAV